MLEGFINSCVHRDKHRHSTELSSEECKTILEREMQDGMHCPFCGRAIFWKPTGTFGYIKKRENYEIYESQGLFAGNCSVSIDHDKADLSTADPRQVPGTNTNVTTLM